MSIVLATDGKPHSNKAVSYALEYAKLRHETLYVVYVVSPKQDEDRESNMSSAKKHIDKIKLEGSQQGIEVVALLESGTPGEACISMAERVGATTIVVGTSGKNVLDRLFIGSVSEYIVRHASCTVIIVR
ncbi:MAG: universal stress protein [Methanomassiliicoccales archaeon]|nr:universal stress protein [Methanomassiliicoccales archaeon]